MMNDIPRRTIVITGCSHGIGRALTETFIQLGHTVYGGARSIEAIEALQKEYQSPHLFHKLDLSDPASVASWAQQILERTTPDILINNAAQIHTPSKIWELDESIFQRLFEVNVWGTIRICQAFLPALIKKNAGMIINLSSGAGRTGIPMIGPYCTTKWAIEGYSKSLQADLPGTIGVIPLSPGIVNTGMLRTIWSDQASQAPDPQTWAQTAAPYILRLTPQQGGESLTTP